MYDTYDSIIVDAAARYAVPFEWIKAVIGTESSFNPNAYRAEPKIADASYGLMQLLLRTARGLGFTGDVSALFDPTININLGSKLLGQLIARYGQDFKQVYSAYNSGDPLAYLKSTQVKTHVDNALAWLAKFAAPVSAGLIAMIVLMLLLIMRGEKPF